MMDFGFTFEDPELPPPKEPQLDPALLAMVESHKELVTKEAHRKVQDIVQLVLPLLENLKRNPESEYIRWPNRVEVIQRMIDKIKTVGEIE